MSISMKLSIAARRIAETAMLFAGLTIACIAGELQPQASATEPELSFSNHEQHHSVSGSAQSEARIAVGNGFVEFVRHADGSVGVGVAGLAAMRAVDTHIGRFNATPLELFRALAPPGAVAPAALLEDHQIRARLDHSIPSTPRALPSADRLKAFVAPYANASGPIFPDPLCASNDYYLWETLFADPNENSSIYWAGHDWGYGTWTGDANITLGSSSAGTLMFCAPPDVWPPGGSPTPEQLVDKNIRLAVHEYVALEGWHQIWFVNVVEAGSVYGYHYKGYVVRKLRMTVRQFPEFFWWAAAF